MTKNRKLIVIGVAVLLVVGVAIASYKVFGTNADQANNGNKNLQSIALDFSKPLCEQIPASVVGIGGAIDKEIIRSEPLISTTSNVCQYYFDATHFVSLRLNNLSYENQKKGQTSLGRSITSNSQINMEHFVAVQENGLINDIVLKISDNMILAVDRSSGTSASEQEIVNLAAKVAEYLKAGIVKTDSSSSNDQVSSLKDEEFINNFFLLIEDKKASEAVMLMTTKNISDDSTKQAWGVQFNNMNSVKVLSITPQNKDAWTNSFRQYKVVLDMVMNPKSASEPIPYYGYTNGQNTRYISLVKEDSGWKIDAIATGP